MRMVLTAISLAEVVAHCLFDFDLVGIYADLEGIAVLACHLVSAFSVISGRSGYYADVCINPNTSSTFFRLPPGRYNGCWTS